MINFTGHTIGRYKILECIGHGGMAVVYKALDTRLGNEVALKFIKKEEFPVSAQEGMLQRFEREAKIMASLSHLNIVKVTDYGEYEGYPYLVMPYMAGGTLKARMGKPIPWSDVVRIILPLTQALGYAHQHQRGTLHRDIKPSNILMSEGDEPVLTDFGIAKIQEEDNQHTLTRTGFGMGTPEYIAPEQWIKKEIDGRADVYALGVVMYEMLSGRQPYTADTPAGVMLKQANEPLPRPGVFVAGLPEPVERVVLKAMAKDAKDRYQSMEEFGKALKGLTGEIHSPMSKWVKPVLIGLLGLGVLITLLVRFVIPGIKEAQALAIEREQTATAQAELLAMASRIAAQTATAAAWTVTPGKIPTNTPSPLSSPTTTLAVTVDPNVPPACTEMGQEWVSPIDGITLVCVPAGEFEMGSNNGDADEKPVHTVYLDSFWIDQTEVTNAQYAVCVAAGVCTNPGKMGSNSRASYYNNSQYENYPVVYVDWYQATTYCDWAGRELPTEAQREKSARGTDSRKFPWGNDINQLLVNSNRSDTLPVGSFPDGVSPYGALDMAGNVWEWVNDWYGGSYYVESPDRNPPGPDNGTYKVLRGGSWYNDEHYLRTSSRLDIIPTSQNDKFGFRCISSHGK